MSCFKKTELQDRRVLSFMTFQGCVFFFKYIIPDEYFPFTRNLGTSADICKVEFLFNLLPAGRTHPNHSRIITNVHMFPEVTKSIFYLATFPTTPVHSPALAFKAPVSPVTSIQGLVSLRPPPAEGSTHTTDVSLGPPCTPRTFQSL